MFDLKTLADWFETFRLENALYLQYKLYHRTQQTIPFSERAKRDLSDELTFRSPIQADFLLTSAK